MNRITNGDIILNFVIATLNWWLFLLMVIYPVLEVGYLLASGLAFMANMVFCLDQVKLGVDRINES